MCVSLFKTVWRSSAQQSICEFSAICRMAVLEHCYRCWILGGGQAKPMSIKDCKISLLLGTAQEKILSELCWMVLFLFIFLIGKRKGIWNFVRDDLAVRALGESQCKCLEASSVFFWWIHCVSVYKLLPVHLKKGEWGVPFSSLYLFTVCLLSYSIKSCVFITLGVEAKQWWIL